MEPTDAENYGAIEGTSPSPRRISAEGRNLSRKSVWTKRSGWQFHLASLAVLVFVPFGIFIAVSFSFAFMCYYPNIMAYMVLGFFLILCFLLMNLPGVSYQYQGGLGLLACAFGFVMGEYTHGAHIMPWWSINHRVTYTNVLASEPAATKVDAGLISFAEGTYVDTLRSLGHRAPLLEKDVYCVAPILDDSVSNTVNYWAVGHDCCGSSFRFDCGQPHNPRASAGVVYIDSSDMFAYHDYKRFEEAAKQAAAFYNLFTSTDPIFVTWVEDPQYEMQLMWDEGLLWLLFANSICLVVSIVVAVFVHYVFSPARQRSVK